MFVEALCHLVIVGVGIRGFEWPAARVLGFVAIRAGLAVVGARVVFDVGS
jgi:hypothetical protein